MTPLDADRGLALAYVPAARRAAVEALWRLDATLGAVLAGGREPMISRIKLAWWRDALAGLDAAPAPAEPTLQLIADEVLPLGISGVELAAMEEGWALLLSEEPLTDAELEGYAAARGALLFAYSARLLGAELSDPQRKAGEAWALVDLARRSNNVDAKAALKAASARMLPSRWAAAIRPLGMLASLAERDLRSDALEAPGAPGRMLRMIRHRLTGR